MKRIDAKWDTRSLEVTCAELEVGISDTNIDLLNEALDWLEGFEYGVVKVSAGNVGAGIVSQKRGFTYIESSIEVAVDLRKVEFPRLVKRFEPDITPILATPDSCERIFNQIRSGMFDTDRIFLDPVFSKELAANRYVNWIRDEIKLGALLYHVYYKDDEVGFFVYKETEPGVEASPFLAGLYNEWKSSGLGVNVVVAVEMREAIKRGCSRIVTHVSSNNMPILRIHELLGYHVSNMQYVFVKHQ